MAMAAKAVLDFLADPAFSTEGAQVSFTKSMALSSGLATIGGSSPLEAVMDGNPELLPPVPGY